MRANLSLVLDQSGFIRYDLLKNLPLEEIDQYTATKESGKEVREDFKEEIAEYLKLQNNYLSTMKRKTQGRIIVTYNQQDNALYTLRVIYQNNQRKLNSKETLNEIIRNLKNLATLELTIALIQETGFLNSQFAKHKIELAKRKMLYGKKREKAANNELVHAIIKNTLVPLLEKDPEKAYFYIRKLDSYLEKRLPQKEEVQPKETIKKPVSNLQCDQITLEEYLKDQSFKIQKKESSAFPNDSIAKEILKEYQESGEPFRMADFALEYSERLEKKREERIFRK